VYGRKPGAFEERLADLGFRISPRSRSNYLETDETVPSMFEMMPFAELPDSKPERWRRLQHNRAFDILRAPGYETVSFGSRYPHVDLVSADRFIDAGTADLNEIRLLGATGLREIVD